MAAYDRVAPRWERMLERLGHPDAYEAFLRGIGPGGRVLDLGCGTGKLWLAALRGGELAELTLADPSEAMLFRAADRVSRTGARATAVHGGIGDERLPPQSYDLVLVGQVIDHRPDPQAALRWIAARLAPGGRR